MVADFKPVILRVTVEISADRSETIQVHEGDEAEPLALQFIAEQGLGDSLIGPLTAHIQKNLDQIKTSKPEQVASNAATRPPRAVAAPKRSVGTPRKTGSAPRTPQSRGSASSTRTASQGPFSYRGPTTERPKSRDGPRSARERRDDDREAMSGEMGRTPSASSGVKDFGSTSSHNALSERSADGVFEKLYQDAARKKFKVEHLRHRLERDEEDHHQSTSMTHAPGSMRCAAWSRNSDDAGSLGERLYQDAIQKQLKQKHVQIQREHKEREEHETATFRPDLQASQRGCQGVARSMQDYCGIKTKAKIEQMRRAKERKSMDGCTFKPAIDPKSEKLMSQRIARLKITGNLYDHLYDDAQRRQDRMVENATRLPSGTTFAPDIGVDHFRPPNDDTREDFINRLAYSKSCSDKWLSLQREQRQRESVPHRPQTGRPPLFDRNPERLPIGDFLYEVGKDVKALQTQMHRTVDAKMANEISASKVSETSRQLFEEKKRRKYETLFRTLTTKDADNLLRASTISTEGLAPEMLEFLKNLVSFLQETGESLELEPFCAALDYQRDHCGRPTAHLFVEKASKRTSERFRKERQEYETFTPRTNSVSNKIAARHRPRSALPVYEQLIREKEGWEQRREEERLMKEERDMHQCTFQPNAKVHCNGELSPGRALNGGEVRHTRSDPQIAGIRSSSAPRISNQQALLPHQDVKRPAGHVDAIVEGTEACAARLNAFHAQIDQAEQAVQRCKLAVQKAKDTVAEVNHHSTAPLTPFDPPERNTKYAK